MLADIIICKMGPIHIRIRLKRNKMTCVMPSYTGGTQTVDIIPYF